MARKKADEQAAEEKKVKVIKVSAAKAKAVVDEKKPAKAKTTAKAVAKTKSAEQMPEVVEKKTAKAKATTKTTVAKAEAEPIEVKLTEAKPKRTKTAAKTKAAAAKAETAETEIAAAKPKRATRAKKAEEEKLLEVIEVSEAVPSRLLEFDIPEELQTNEPLVSPALDIKKKSPVFLKLAEPVLPSLPSENRARLQMQSPNRIFFYWTIKSDPFETLNRALGTRAAGYTLTAKLMNLTRNTEEVYPVDSKGSWWFNVDSDSSYRAEVGFFAPDRPFVRLMFSNTIDTPRSAPSARKDWSPAFHATAGQFAAALDVSGFRQDAFDVALAGDDLDASDDVTQNAYTRLTGKRAAVSSSEIRYALFALASGVTLESLEGYISPGLYDELNAMAGELGAQKIKGILQDTFGYDPLESEYEDEELPSAAVFGASLVNFPKGLRRKKAIARVSPISSGVRR